MDFNLSYQLLSLLLALLLLFLSLSLFPFSQEIRWDINIFAEPAVVNLPITILADTPDVLAVDKPSSIPVCDRWALDYLLAYFFFSRFFVIQQIHPSGSYRHNTILNILASEYGYTSKIYRTVLVFSIYIYDFIYIF